MAYYTDVTRTVPFDTSNVITRSALANVVADMLVSYAGFTLVGYATEGVASSASNYAEVAFGNLYIRLYGTSTSAGSISLYLYYSGGVDSGRSVTFATTGSSSLEITLRFYNAKNGTAISVPVSGYYVTLIKATVRKFGDATEYGAVFTRSNNNYFQGMVDDGSTSSYPTPTSGGYMRDYFSIVQLMMPLWFGTTTALTSAYYYFPNYFRTPSPIMTGFVAVSGRYFYFSEAISIELNP